MASVVALFIVAGALILGIQQWSAMLTKKQIQNNSKSFYNRIVYLQTQFKAYQSDQYLSGTSINSQFIFPIHLKDLEGDYIPTCSDEDNQKGLCFKYNQTPWGEISDSDYRLVPLPNGINPTHWQAELDIELPPKNDEALKYEREVVLQLFGANMPNILPNEEKDKITIIINRPDKAFAYESLVKRSGDDSTLLGDWDVGGEHAIMNAKDFSVQNDDGSQTSISNKLVSIYSMSHGDWVDYPKCPTGQKPSITPVISRIDSQSGYKLLGNQRAYVLLDDSIRQRWQIGLDVAAQNINTNKNTILHNGTVSVFVQCK